MATDSFFDTGAAIAGAKLAEVSAIAAAETAATARLHLRVMVAPFLTLPSQNVEELTFM
jgi:hypothetical protein